MKKLITSFAIATIILSVNTTSTFALQEKTEISTKQYVKTLKTYIKKEKFDEIEKPYDLDLFKSVFNHIKIKKKGMDLAYIEPTIEQIKENKKQVNELITFLESNTTKDKKINDISEEMLTTLNEMLSDLEYSCIEYSSQVGFNISDDEKEVNLSGSSHCFNDSKTYAYDYIDHYNNRVEKVEKMYKYIKEIS